MRADAQSFLPLRGQTVCGYCDEPLTQMPEGDWACAGCRPHLARISTEAEWLAFHRSAARRRKPKEPSDAG